MRRLLTSVLVSAAASLAAAPLAAQQGPLDALVAEGLQNNLGIASTRLATRRAETEVDRARGALLPSLDLNGRYSEYSGVFDLGQLINPAYAALNQLTGTNNFPTNLSLVQPFKQDVRVRFTQPVIVPAAWADLALRRAQRDGSRQRLGAEARGLAATIQLAWLQHHGAEQAVALWNSTVPLLEENVRVSERLVAAGSAVPEVVFRARAELASAEQSRRDAIVTRDDARRQFNRVMHRPLEQPVEEVADSLLAQPIALDVDGAVTSAKQAREELGEADAGVRTAEAAQRLATASFLPLVAVSVDGGFTGPKLEFSGNNDFAALSVTVQWNLFSGGQDLARRREAAYDAARARLQREDVAIALEQQVRNAHAAAASAWASLATADARLAAAERTFTLVRRRYDEGLASHIEFTDARTSYTNAGLNRIISRIGYAARAVELERAAATRTITQ